LCEFIVNIYIVVTSRLQETFSDDLREAGRIPRTVDCELTRDLGKSLVFVTVNSGMMLSLDVARVLVLVLVSASNLALNVVLVFFQFRCGYAMHFN